MAIDSTMLGYNYCLNNYFIGGIFFVINYLLLFLIIEAIKQARNVQESHFQFAVDTVTELKRNLEKKRKTLRDPSNVPEIG